ncbi:conserved domain protein [Gardnerella vaginalis 315-A]|nr:conserved domain protein [Gardnerella vaginalis 315-A]
MRHYLPPFLQLNLDIYIRRQVNVHQRIHSLWRWINDVNEALMSAHLEMLARILIFVRRTDNNKHVLLGRQRNRTHYCGARVRHRLDDFLRRLVDDLMVIGLKPDADFLSRHCRPPFLAIRLLFTNLY